MIRIIRELEKAGLKLIPLQANKIEECVVYKYYATQTFKYRLELRVVAFSFENADTMAKKVISAINDIGDTAKVEGISSIALNGGGLLVDNETHTTQNILYFDVAVKEK